MIKFTWKIWNRLNRKKNQISDFSDFYFSSYEEKTMKQAILWMPLSANLLKLESSILPRAKRATNRNNVASEQQIYKKKFWRRKVRRRIVQCRNGGAELAAPKRTRPEILNYHCLIHQQQLCALKLNMKVLMTDIVEVVNFIRSRGLNHREFKAYLDEVGSEYEDVYFSKVRWLNRAATLKRFQLLLPEIKQFMEKKKQNVDFIENEEWLNDFSFLVDITKNELNLICIYKENTSYVVQCSTG